ncbi:CoA transferase [Candidatus Binatia bacterium]|nr:CoA transferase [Candidatus Binatia bacterium]
MHDPARPLAGLRVVDLTWGLAGALATLVLADEGAEVVRVEPPGGDALRTQAAFPLWLRGKMSVVIDLRTASGRDDLLALLDGADVLVESFRPATAARLGLAPGVTAARHPRLVHASITGFGHRGPYANVKGYEGIVQAKLGGMMHVAGMAPRPGPAFPAVPYASFSAAMCALQGILAALYVRERCGMGQHVETSLVQGLAAHDPWEWFLRVLFEKYPDAFSAAAPYSPRGVPNTGFAFRLLVCLTKDGRWLQFSQTSPHLFREFMEVLGLAWMFDDPEWSSAPDFDTEEKREAFWERMLAAARERTLDEWQRVFEERPNVWAEVFRTTRDLLEHPQMRHNGQVADGELPQLGRVRQLGALVGHRGAPTRAPAPPPRLGEHDDLLVAARARVGTEAQVGAGPGPGAAWALPSPAGHRSPPRRALDGVTVLELGIWYAAPFGGALLADLGARVIKVEPLAGEPMRSVLPVPEAGAVKVLQGKESIALDIATDEGRAIVHELARRADVVLLGYRAGVAEKLGVDATTLQRVNPRVVCVASPGYGVDGPCGRKPAFAPTIGVASGAALFQAGPSIPYGPDLTLDEIKRASIRLNYAAQAPGNADGASALGVAVAMLLGLVARERTGEAPSLLTSMLCTTAYAVSDDGIDYAGRPPRVEPDPLLYGMGALYRLYACANGWVFLASPQEREWPGLCAALTECGDAGARTLARDARFTTSAVRARHDAALAEELARVFAARDADEWERLLLARDVACVAVAEGPVARSVMCDPVTREAGMLAEVEHPTFGVHRRLAPVVTLSVTPGEARPAPMLGMHTETVLRELGFDDEQIAVLVERGVAGRPA